MASTNKTANYQLSQFTGTDKPAWLGDYNSDMNKIDTQMKANADANTATLGIANGAVSSAESAQATAETAQTTAETAQTMANQAQTSATTANDGVQYLKNKFNLNTIANLTWTSSIGNVASNNTKCVHNGEGSVGKVYGTLGLLNSAGSTNVVITSSDTGLRPDADIDIYGNFFLEITRSDTGAIFIDTIRSMTVRTDGTIQVTLPNNAVYVGKNVTFIACLLFMDDFGD